MRRWIRLFAGPAAFLLLININWASTLEFKLDGTDWKLTPLMPSEWEARSVWDENWNPRAGNASAPDWLPATVPGDVVRDSVDAGLVPQPYLDANSRACEWLAQRDWVYRKDFTIPASFQGKHLRLKFGGVDFDCRVYLNGVFLGKHVGLLEPFEFDISDRVQWDKKNWLVILIRHAPPVDVVQGQVGYTNEARVWKPRFAYSWDWCTRLVTLGIWQNVTIAATGPSWFDDVCVRPHVEADQARIEIHAAVSSTTSTAASGEVKLTLLSPDGNSVGKGNIALDGSGNSISGSTSIDVTAPQLWWPNGMGNQPLYSVRAELFDSSGNHSDETSVTFGIRTLKLIPNDGATTDALPYTIQVNGRRLFAKGWNWVPIDHMYGRVQPDRYERLLQLAKMSHANLLRVWGGGYLERQEFYDICDRLGLLVWQEFMQSSSGIVNWPAKDPDYCDYVEQQARAMVPQRRNHASLLLWCGGNELFDEKYIPLTSDYPPLARLKKVVEELDPGRAFLPCSPSGPEHHINVDLKGTGRMHDVHGIWRYAGPIEEYRIFNNIDPLFHSEFGVEGAANLVTLKQFISPSYLWPPDASNPMWIHHGNWWIHRDMINRLFGEVSNIEDFVRASQFMQAEGLRYAVESDRRQQWHCSGCMPWQLNEAFPNSACSNTVDYLGLPKPAFWWVRRAYEPVHISAKYDKVQWNAGENWHAELWANNDGPPENCRWEARAFDLNGRELQKWSGASLLAGDSATSLTTLSRVTGSSETVYLALSLQSDSGKVLSRNDYFFSTLPNVFSALLQAPVSRISKKQEGDQLSLHNTSDVPALMLQIDPASKDWKYPSADYFCLMPGETKTIEGVTGKAPVIKGWNCEE